jgi:hypothetical protein
MKVIIPKKNVYQKKTDEGLGEIMYCGGGL